MSWLYHNIVSQYGDFLRLNTLVDCNQLLTDIKDYEWIKYNPARPEIPRDCINVTSIKGNLKEMTGSLIDTDLTDLDFNVPTEVYYKSKTLQKLLQPWKKYLGRAQFLRLPPGGYFPPHHDGGRHTVPNTFRLIVPIKNANAPDFCWMYGDEVTYKPLSWMYGYLYFLNTMKKHWLFNASKADSIWLTLNVEVCEDTAIKIRELVH